MQNKFKPCPCGRIPEKLHIVPRGQGEKWSLAVGACCGEWHVEFLANRQRPIMESAVEAWNHAPRNRGNEAVERLGQWVQELQERLVMVESFLIGLPVIVKRGNPDRGPGTGPGYGRNVRAQICRVVDAHRMECELLEDDPGAVGVPCKAGERGVWEAGRIALDVMGGGAAAHLNHLAKAGG